MNTRARLDKVFRDAFPVPFDRDSKFVFFSDVHRGDDSISDEFGRNRHIYFRALDYYNDNEYTYIEIGDGDELLEQKDYRHIYSAHPQIFDLLRRFFEDDRMHMLYGNHNLQLRKDEYLRKNLYHVYDDYSDSYVPLFPGMTAHEALILTERESGQQIFVVHGHQGDLISDQLWFVSFVMIRFFWRFMHLLGVKYAASPARNREHRHKVELNYNKWNEDRHIMLICGHTHRPRFPKKGEPAYFNSGCCIHPRGITCLELENNEISLISWRMHSKKDGSLYIRRTVLQGPEPIASFRMEEVEWLSFRKKKIIRPKLDWKSIEQKYTKGVVNAKK